MLLPFESKDKLLNLILKSDGSTTNNIQILVDGKINVKILSENEPIPPFLLGNIIQPQLLKNDLEQLENINLQKPLIERRVFLQF